MRKAIRRYTWETNSSTTHSTVILLKDDSERWGDENLYYCVDDWKWREMPDNQRPEIGKLYSKEEVLKFYELTNYPYDPDGDKDELTFIKNHYDFERHSDWWDNEYLNYDEHSFVTPGGEEIVVYCKYGND